MQPFAKLGKSLNLPQTSVLSLQAPLRVPLLDEDAFMWYPSFDNLGERAQPLLATSLGLELLTSIVERCTVVASPDPTLAVELVCKVLDHLTGPCKWPATSIHLFGFAQGGSIAAHAALEYAQPLASVISISGPLLSYQTGARDKRTSPPSILLVRRMGEERSVQVNNFRRAFEDVKEVVLRTGQGMPRERSEWEDIMRCAAASTLRSAPEAI